MLTVFKYPTHIMPKRRGKRSCISHMLPGEGVSEQKRNSQIVVGVAFFFLCGLERDLKEATLLI